MLQLNGIVGGKAPIKVSPGVPAHKPDRLATNRDDQKKRQYL